MSFASFLKITAVAWGRLYATAKKQNRLLPLEDSLIQAIALSHKLTVAINNERDFFQVQTVNPWLYDEAGE